MKICSEDLNYFLPFDSQSLPKRAKYCKRKGITKKAYASCNISLQGLKFNTDNISASMTNSMSVRHIANTMVVSKREQSA